LLLYLFADRRASGFGLFLVSEGLCFLKTCFIFLLFVCPSSASRLCDIFPFLPILDWQNLVVFLFLNFYIAFCFLPLSYSPSPPHLILVPLGLRSPDFFVPDEGFLEVFSSFTFTRRGSLSLPSILCFPPFRFSFLPITPPFLIPGCPDLFSFPPFLRDFCRRGRGYFSPLLAHVLFLFFLRGPFQKLAAVFSSNRLLGTLFFLQSPRLSIFTTNLSQPGPPLLSLWAPERPP